MRASIEYQFDRRRYVFYLGDANCCVWRGADGVLLIKQMKPGERMHPYLELEDEEYMAIKDAIITRESPMIADRNFLVAALDRERETADRLLTLVEDGWAG